MRRLHLLTFVAPLLAALACNDATAPPSPANPEIRPPQRTLVIPSTTPQVSAGDLHTCALKADGTVVCWGYNYNGEATVPIGLASVAQVNAGGYHNCALKTDGTVICWGSNGYGQTTVPSGLASVARGSPGYQHTCALKTDGTVACWGRNYEGQATVPGGLASVTEVSAGILHTCALKTDGTVACWGWNGYGQVTVPDGLASVAQVSAGGFHTCALKIAGTVVCWGRNDYGQGTVPAGLASVVQLSAGDYMHTCALKTDRTVVCWGYNGTGEATVPSGLSDVIQVSAGGHHTCVLKTDGTVVCWGDNYYGHNPAAVPAGLNLNFEPPNQPPVVGAITAPVAPAQVNTTITANANLTDAGTLDTHTAAFNWGDGTSSAATVTEASGSGSASGTHVYSAAGVYTVTLTVTDNAGATAQSVFEFVVIFDPAAGFVSGSGLIDSPSGAYAADISLSGKATFGFVSRYQNGATVPDGNTQFQFHAGNLKFKSTVYDWLVIAGPQAKYKGSGTINGSGDFGFLLSAVDGDVNGGGGTDKFRIKIWDKATGDVIYDNQMGATDNAAATTAIAGGSIMIHN